MQLQQSGLVPGQPDIEANHSQAAGCPEPTGHPSTDTCWSMSLRLLSHGEEAMYTLQRGPRWCPSSVQHARAPVISCCHTMSTSPQGYMYASTVWHARAQATSATTWIDPLAHDTWPPCAYCMSSNCNMTLFQLAAYSSGCPLPNKCAFSSRHGRAHHQIKMAGEKSAQGEPNNTRPSRDTTLAFMDKGQDGLVFPSRDTSIALPWEVNQASFCRGPWVACTTPSESQISPRRRTRSTEKESYVGRRSKAKGAVSISYMVRFKMFMVSGRQQRRT